MSEGGIGTTEARMEQTPDTRPVTIASRLHIALDSSVLVFLCLLSLVIRAPAFFTDVINWDESTFILIGQALANGHLPYTLVWDNKPPLGYAFFSLAEIIFPHSLAAIRVVGSFAVAVSAFFVYAIASSIVSLAPALLGAVLFVTAVSIFISQAQAVMMEHVALMPLLAALWMLLKETRTGLRSCLETPAGGLEIRRNQGI